MKHSNGRQNPPALAASSGRRRLLRAAAALPLAVLAPGCTVPVPGQGPPPELYRLTPKSTFRDGLPTAEWQLVLEPPVADAGLNTTRIALQRSPTRIQYYARAGWADRAPLMVQTLMVESFENSRKIVSVGRESIGLRADFILKSELREMQAVYYNGDLPQAWVGINVKLVQMPRRAIVASRSFEHKAEAEADRLPEIVKAFDLALDKVLRHLVEWTLIEGEKAFQGRPRSS